MPPLWVINSFTIIEYGINSFGMLIGIIIHIHNKDWPVFVMNVNDDTYEHTKRIDPILNNGERIDYPQWGHGFLSAYPDKVAHEINKFHHKVEG